MSWPCSRLSTLRSKVNSKGTRMSVKRVLLLLLVILYADVGFSLTIATGPSDGTYIQIARDIQKVAQKDGVKVEILATQGSFENMVLLGDRKVDLAIAQIDALGFFAKRSEERRVGKECGSR